MLETTWFILWGLLWAIYLASDGFDFGLGTLLPFLGRSEGDRKLIVNSMGPFWDGNEVWLVTAGGVTFAAFPRTYATMFSAMYIPLMLLLFALIFRGVAFEFRAKVDSARWRRIWDGCLFVGSAAPAVLLGVFFANLFAGIPIDAQGVLQGGLIDFLHPYALLGGVLFLTLFIVHGALWLAIMVEGDLLERALHVARTFWPASIITVVLFLLTSTYRTDLFTNYLNHPWLFLILVFAVAAFIMTRVFLARRSLWPAFTASALAIGSTALFGVVGMFPNTLISSINPMYNVTAFNSASSALTLKIMLGIALAVLPVVIGYQGWVYYRFGRKLKLEELEDGHSY
ncbi:MAG TPA: cytochrome d ubiquinol oxidase subunit II [Bdellovibrionales bacterium]|nr:MAG: cytochrome d ubiquinol oxidase subunit II [Bdellovibrionales bacterium GWB1_52_6]OFZ02845.1 MAG: cytochrome d ubiquinol oxidase subunit II [Bdellovibrionales bacterium GWA1_52_35]OFZ33484.1 MAG: cytochrome d ubiquinol oxidase subunit II [Bdellovibrionales bacterium GWC1_52_8]HAR41093.1 cytochrome d ubiquinol oxidase subunit II [Bdellovibrionales bacterium]HCM38427.1 cytochrome d ubiquinol oxidase subunit II [Bdellovibrionales bacterium]